MQPISFKPCPECGGRRVTTTAIVGNIMGMRNQDGSIIYILQKARRSNWFKGLSNRSEVQTLTCVDCGYIMWYALTPSNLIPDES